MSRDDPAFLWETEAMRISRTRRDHREPAVGAATAPQQEFVTLSEASTSTGIPVNTLRKWTRRGAVASFLDMRTDKPVRMVNLEAVRTRAESLGRELDVQDEATIDLTRSAPRPAAAPAPVAERQPAPGEPDPAPTGTMIVPISAWEKMLNQLGNLHEAGREMAEARERAARAETEAMFLRERLKELRAELDVAGANDAPSPADPEPAAATTPQPTPDAPLWKRAYEGWRKRR